MKKTLLDDWIAERLGAARAVLSRKLIEHIQLERLRETIGWVKTRSRFYRDHLAGFSADDLNRLEDLRNLPFTSAEEIRRQPQRFLCVSQSEVSRVVTLQTSGTTGDPKRVFFTVEDQERTIDFFHHGMSTLVGPGDRVLILMPGTHPGSVGDLLVKGLGRLGAVGVPHGPVRDVPETLRIMHDQRIDALVGIPVQVLGLCRQSGGSAAPRAVLLSADYVPEAVSRELRHTWNCEVFAHYGMTEMGFGGGVECAARRGYHLREADFHFEVVNPRTGAPMESGETGEVVFTTLTRRGMPLVRYRTGDISRFLPGPCPCGSTLKTLEKVAGRLDSIHLLESGTSLTMADLDEAIFSEDGILDFEATLLHQAGVDRLRIEALVVEPAGGKTVQAVQAVQHALMEIPAIAAAVDEGVLHLEIRFLHPGTFFTGGPAKRAILDRRGRPHIPHDQLRCHA